LPGSYHALCSLKGIVKACERRGISCLAVTDHNSIEGACRLREVAPFKVIIGEEIETQEGEIIGLFLEKRIPPDLSAEETIERIKEQGGVVYLPHPFGQFRKFRFSQKRLDGLVERIDVVEVFNSRSLNQEFDRRARKFAADNHLLMGAGSDAHTLAEVGRSFVEMEEFKGQEEFLKNLKDARVVGRKTPLSLRFFTNSMVRRGLKVISGKGARGWQESL